MLESVCYRVIGCVLGNCMMSLGVEEIVFHEVSQSLLPIVPSENEQRSPVCGCKKCSSVWNPEKERIGIMNIVCMKSPDDAWEPTKQQV